MNHQFSLLGTVHQCTRCRQGDLVTAPPQLSAVGQWERESEMTDGGDVSLSQDSLCWSRPCSLSVAAGCADQHQISGSLRATW